MTLPSFLLRALLVLTCSSICSLGCDLSESHRLASRKTLLLLEQMMRTPPVFCLKDRHDFEFPQNIFNHSQFQEAQAIFVLREMLQQILNFFSRKDASTAWDETLLVQFYTALGQQLTDLEACQTQEFQEEDSPFLNENSLLAVRKYFRRITLYLQEKKHSPCAWEIVRVEIIRSFSLSTKLRERLLRKD